MAARRSPGNRDPRRARGARARGPSALASELLQLAAEELPARIAAGIPSAARVLEAMRTEASRFYHSDAARARAIARRACIVADRLGDPIASGWSRRILAEAQLFSGRMRQAEDAYAEAARLWRGCGARALLGQLLVGRVHVLSLLGRLGEVETTAREARALLRQAGDHVYLAKLAMNLGNLHFQREECARALAEYDHAAAAFARLRLRDETVIGLQVNRAVALTQLDRDREALAIFDRLDRECASRGFDLLQAQVRMNGAYVHSLRGDFDRALRSLTSASEYFRRTEHPAFLASCLLNHAEIYQQLNLHADADMLAAEAAALFRSEGLRDDCALALSQVALARLATGRSATSALREARRLFRQEQSRSRVALLDLLEARARSRGRASGRRRAVALAQAARGAFRSLRLIRWEVEAVAVLVELEAAVLAPSRRIRMLHELQRRLPPRIYPLQASTVLRLLGAAQSEAGRIEVSARTLARAAGRLEAVRTRVPSEDAKLSFLSDKTEIYERILRLELDRPRPRPERLFEWMERSRAQSLWDRLRQPSAERDDHDPEGSAERQRLSWLHARVSRLELGDAGERARAAGLRAELRESERRWSRLLRARAEKGAATRSGRSGSWAGDSSVASLAHSITGLARLLPPGWGYLSYHLGREVSFVLAITASGVAWRRLASGLSARVGRLADRLDFQWAVAAMQASRRDALPVFSGPLRSATEALLGDLYKELWAPVEELGVSSDTNWIVSPHGPVHRVPFPALLDARGHLVERAAICLAPSARVWAEISARPSRAASRRAWVAGVPQASLPGVAREVRLVARRLRRWQVKMALQPTREDLRRAGRSAGLVHLAAHGSFRVDNPAFSFLDLADGPLLAHDLAEMRFPGSLVVLTACSSGRGAGSAGDEWIGLARGFLQAGASSVVASLWPIPDEPTCDLMDRFYAGLDGGLGVPEALAGAMREQAGRYLHPWNWSGFTVLGGVAARR